ncbi:MAG: hypothetical protein R3D05_18305, partial [Dongiaceae bacterium]
DEDDTARGVQEFGVSHRLRVPQVKLLEAAAPVLHRGQLPDRRMVEIAPVDAVQEAARAPFADQIARASELHRTVLALSELEPEPRLLGLLVLARVTRAGAAEALRTLRKAGFTIALSDDARDPEYREALSGLGLESAADVPPSALGIVGPGQAALESASATIRFGGRIRAVEGGEADIIIARDDPRTLVDLLQFARDFRARTRLAIVAANIPGIVLLSAALGLLPAVPLLLTGAALAGILLGIAVPQALRLSPTLANEVDEE